MNSLHSPSVALAPTAGWQHPATPADSLILVVDDLTTNLKVLQGLLRPVGYQLTFANSGQQAIERVQSVRPDLVLLDLMMPDMDGIQVIQKLKEEPAFRHLPVIFLTANDEIETLVRAFEEGAVDYLTKPFSPAELLARIKTHLELKHLRDRTYRLAQREWIFGKIIQSIHQSLELNDTLQTAVELLRQFLNAHRVMIQSCFLPQSVKTVAIMTTADYPLMPADLESAYCNSPDLPVSTSSVEALQTAVPQPPTAKLQRYGAMSVAPPTASDHDAIDSWHIRTEIQVPIFYETEFWGWLIAHNCEDSQAWGREELELLRRIAEQLSIAIRQASLHEKLQTTNQELQRLSNTDALCQIANRRYLNLYLEKEWRRMGREQQPLAVILFDIDYFKRFNDTYGHLEGDRCLQQVAQAASKVLKRPGDLLARYGGEEFAVILPNTSVSGAAKIAEDIRIAIETLAIPHKSTAVSSLQLTVSLGVAGTVPSADSGSSILIKQVDQALYNAKQTGRNRFSLATA